MSVTWRSLAHSWGARGRGFESRSPDHKSNNKIGKLSPVFKGLKRPLIFPSFPAFSHIFTRVLGKIREKSSKRFVKVEILPPRATCRTRRRPPLLSLSGLRRRGVRRRAMREAAYRVEPLKPREGSWDLKGWDKSFVGFKYENLFGVIAISSVHLIEGKPQWHVSFSQAGRRIHAGFMEALLRQWGCEGWDEDNHTPGGSVRHFWKPVEKSDPQVCPCKANEAPHEEDGGYIWRPDSQTEAV